MENRRVKGSLQGIDIRKISHFIPIFLNAFMLIGRATTAKMPALTGCQRSGTYFQKLAKQQGDCRRRECREAQGCVGTAFTKEWIQSVLDEAEILTSCQFLHSGVLPSARSKDYDHRVENLLDNMAAPCRPWHRGSSPSPPNGGTSSSMSRED